MRQVFRDLLEEDEDLIDAAGNLAPASGSPDAVFGQVIKAVIVSTDPALDAQAVVEFCRGRVADYKLPKIVTFMDALPLAPSGKVLKSALV